MWPPTITAIVVHDPTAMCIINKEIKLIKTNIWSTKNEINISLKFLLIYLQWHDANRATGVLDQILQDGPILSDPLPSIWVLLTTLWKTFNLMVTQNWRTQWRTTCGSIAHHGADVWQPPRRSDSRPPHLEESRIDSMTINKGWYVSISLNTNVLWI